MGTLLRVDPELDYTPENTFIAPRVQFLAIEVLRNREGFNDALRAPPKGARLLAPRARCDRRPLAEGADALVFQLQACAVCRAYAPFRCNACKLTRYCSRECQRTDWPEHKKVCKSL
eukprot:TRINITY_DN1039_c0_g1_i3.p2 TRINITY_DN1039_c0_g1~~TRINITY_DN1039_c0_g1_i3.p2  ORF type:complete len:117 (+),score=25.26 TRINITY_DN1039_c0_g1_i3:418-768(+)